MQHRIRGISDERLTQVLVLGARSFLQNWNDTVNKNAIKLVRSVLEIYAIRANDDDKEKIIDTIRYLFETNSKATAHDI